VTPQTNADERRVNRRQTDDAGAEPMGEATKHYGHLVGTAEFAEQARQNRAAASGRADPLKLSGAAGRMGPYWVAARRSPA